MHPDKRETPHPKGVLLYHKFWHLPRKVLVRMGVGEDLIEGLGLKIGEYQFLWLWAPGLNCFNKDEVSNTWLIIRGELWVSKDSLRRDFFSFSFFAIIWRNTPSFSTRTYTPYGDFFTATWLACNPDTSLPWKPVQSVKKVAPSLHTMCLCVY